MPEYKHLSFASSLCRNCSEVCAVKINLHELLLENRHSSVDQKNSAFAERMAWKIWAMISLNRGMMNLGNGFLKNVFINKILRVWGKRRADLEFTPKTFNQMWKKQEKGAFFKKH